MTRGRIAVAVAGALLLTFAVPQAGFSAWTSPATLTSSVASGSVAISSSSAFTSLSLAYSSSALTVAAAVQVVNSGSVRAPFALTLSAPASSSLATAVVVRTWPVDSAASSACSSTATVPATATLGNWTNVPVLRGTLGAGASTFYCVVTSITSAQATSLAGLSLTATQSLTAAVGGWSSTATALTAVQSVLDSTAPTSPTNVTASGTTASSTTLSWTSSTDNVGVTGYHVYRGGARIATTTATSYIDSTVAASTSYSYTIAAVDAAGNVSTPSTAVAVTTPAVANYRISHVGSGKCIDPDGSAQSGSDLTVRGCSGSSNQLWQRIPTSDGYVKIVSRGNSSVAWGIATDAVSVQLLTYSAALSQQWLEVAEVSGAVHFVNRGSGKCLDLPGTTNGTQLRQLTCNATATQSFALTLVP